MWLDRDRVDFLKPNQYLSRARPLKKGMSEHVLSDLGLNQSHASTTTQSSNTTEAYLVMERMQLRENLSQSAVEDIDIKDFFWKVSIWDVSAHRLTRDLIESFDPTLEAEEREKLYVLELLESCPVHLVVSVNHCLTGMPFATGACLLTFDQEMHDVELILTTDPSSGLTQEDIEFTFLSSYAIISDTLDVTRWKGTGYDFQQTMQPKVSALIHEYRMFPSGKEMEISLSEDVYEVNLEHLLTPIKGAKASRRIKTEHIQPSEVYYATVDDIQLAPDIHQKFEHSKLCVTVRLTPRLKRGNSLIEGTISDACFLGYLIDGDGLWSKDVQLGVPLREDTLSFSLDVYILAVPINAQIEHEQHMEHSGSVEMVCHGKYKVPVHGITPLSRSIQIDLHRAPSEVWTEVIRKSHISENLSERLPACGKIDMVINNFFVRKHNLWIDLLNENIKSLEIYEKYKKISFQAQQCTDIGLSNNNVEVKPISVHTSMVRTPVVVSSWRGNEWYCLSALANRLKLCSRISKRLDLEPPVLAKSALLSPGGRSLSPNSPFSPGSPGSKKARKSSLLRGDEKELAIIALATSIVASLADSTLPLEELSQKLCPKEEAAFSGTGRALQFMGPDYVMPLLWMVVMNWKNKPDIASLMKFNIYNTFNFSKKYSSSRTEVFVTMQIRHASTPLIQYEVCHHEHELKAVEVILKMVYSALNFNSRLSSLQILGVTGVTTEAIKELVNLICTNVFICPLLIDLVSTLENHEDIDEIFVRDYCKKGHIVLRLLSSLTTLEQELFTEETITIILAFVADSLRVVASHVAKVHEDYNLYAQYACSAILLLRSLVSHSEFYVEVLTSVLKSLEVVIDGTEDSVFMPVLSMLLELAETNFLLYNEAHEKRSSKKTDNTKIDVVAESRLLPVSFGVLSLFFKTHLPLTDTCRFVCILATKCLVIDFKIVHSLVNLLSELRFLSLISNVSTHEDDVSINSIPKILKLEVPALLAKLHEKFHERRIYSSSEKYEIASALLLLSKYLASYAVDILMSPGYESLVSVVLSRITPPHDPKHSYVLIGLMHLGVTTAVSDARQILFRVSYVSYLEIICVRANTSQGQMIEITSKHMKTFEEYAKILVKYVGIAALEDHESVSIIEAYLSGLFDFDPSVVRSLHRTGDAQTQLLALVEKEDEFFQKIHAERGFTYKPMIASAVKSQLKRILGAYNFFISCAKNNKLFDLSCKSMKPVVSTKPISEFVVHETTKASEVLKCLEDKHLMKMLDFEEDLQHMMLLTKSIEDYYDLRWRGSLMSKAHKKSMVTYSHTLLYMSSLANLLSIAPIDAAASLLGRCTLLDSLKSILIYDGSSASHFGIANTSAVAVHRFIVRLHYSYMSVIEKVSDLILDQSTGNFIMAPNSPKRKSGEKTVTTKDKTAVRIKICPISSGSNELLYNDALECISQLNSCGEWKCSIKIIDALMSIYAKIPGFKDQTDDVFNNRIVSMKKELNISRDICTEKLDADVKLVPKPLFYAVRFTSPPRGGTGEFWVVYRFDASCFAAHFDGLSPVGIPPGFYTEFVSYLKTEFPHYLPYPSNSYFPADDHMRVMQIFHAHPVYGSAEKTPLNSPTTFHVYTIDENDQIFAQSEALDRVNVESTFSMTAVNKFTLCMSVSEEEHSKKSFPEEQGQDESEVDVNFFRDDIVQLKELTTWTSPVNLLTVRCKESIEQSKCSLEVLKQQSSLLQSIRVMLDEILIHTPSAAITEGLDCRLICVKSIFMNAITHLANILVGDVNREFYEGSQCFGLHNADVVIAGEEERRALHWHSIRKNEKRKQIKEQEEEISHQKRSPRKQMEEPPQNWYDYGNDVGSPTKTNVTISSNFVNEKPPLGARQLDLSVLEVTFNNETASIISHLSHEKEKCEGLCNYIIDRLWQIADTFFPLHSNDCSDNVIDDDTEWSVPEPTGDVRTVRELIGWVDGAFSTIRSGTNV